jgi:hypothetical protein
MCFAEHQRHDDPGSGRRWHATAQMKTSATSLIFLSTTLAAGLPPLARMRAGAAAQPAAAPARFIAADWQKVEGPQSDQMSPKS